MCTHVHRNSTCTHTCTHMHTCAHTYTHTCAHTHTMQEHAHTSEASRSSRLSASFDLSLALSLGAESGVLLTTLHFCAMPQNHLICRGCRSLSWSSICPAVSSAGRLVGPSHKGPPMARAHHLAWQLWPLNLRCHSQRLTRVWVPMLLGGDCPCCSLPRYPVESFYHFSRCLPVPSLQRVFSEGHFLSKSLAPEIHFASFPEMRKIHLRIHMETQRTPEHKTHRCPKGPDYQN